ncbi:charged multivesicular body protein 2b-A-like [Carassius carassius]|uniref:charged multivesicular body protein 2b-A-like n=1 Tax=Carassius carassius TaxID=217509 RepID=UPI002868CDBB|nr:charged multivesicular body protein 2b-A-like [Carassius carassius]
MQTVNKRLDPKKTLETMHDFQKENLKTGMTEDTINDTLDEICDESGDEEECQDIMNQVLDEIGIEISGKMVRAPSAGKILPGAPPAKYVTENCFPLQ